MAFSAALRARAELPWVSQAGNVLVMSNGNSRLEYNLTTGTADFFWKGSKKISGFYSGVNLEYRVHQRHKLRAAVFHTISSNEVVITATGKAILK